GRGAGREASRRWPRGPALLDPVARVARRRRHSGVSGRARCPHRQGAALGACGAPRLGPRYIIGIGPDAMFTGIVGAQGRVESVSPNGGKGKGGGGRVLRIRAPFRGLKKGESIAINGACLSVERVVKGGFTVHVVQTTEARTLFTEYAAGRRVNLERALRATDRIGGHFV